MGQEFSNTLVAGSSSGEPPEEFDGLISRYNTLATTDTAYVANNGASTGSTNTSIWFIQWGAGKVYLIYPRNTEGGGIKKEDKGLTYTLSDASSNTPTVEYNNKQLWAYITEFSWDVGLCVEDTRSVKRLGNISTVPATDTNTLDEDKIIECRYNFKTPGTVFMYCNEDTYVQLMILAKDKQNVHWEPNNPFGKPIMYFHDMPVRRLDAITSTESILTT